MYLEPSEKEDIKKAILKAVENGCTEPELLLSKLISTFERIERIGQTTKGHSLES